MREVYIWSQLRHVNVQELLGVVEIEGGLGMVSPWMEHGNLQDYIKLYPNVERYQFVGVLFYSKPLLAEPHEVYPVDFGFVIPTQRGHGEGLFLRLAEE